jgi:hypothetical protein
MNANVLPFAATSRNLNGGQIMTASAQWRSRPADQRFTSLHALNEHARAQRLRSAGRVLPSRGLEARPVEGDPSALVVVGPSGAPVETTHWSFGQLAARSGAPAGYLRKLPTPLAADCLNYGLRVERDVEELGVLLERPESSGALPTLRAVTGPNYGRIWNSQITTALVDRFGDGLTGDFRVPGEFGKAVPVTRDNTTLYASDRDMFVFLADEVNRIEVPNRRNGASGSLARGFFVWNSEVGSTSWGIALFLFDYACMNRIIWGAQEYVEVRGRHTSSAPEKWLHQVTPMLHQYAQASAAPVQAAIAAAQRKRIDNVDGFLRQRFTAGVTEAIKLAHFADEQRPIESLWDAATGITAYARTIEHQDERVSVERTAGKLLTLAA